ncbi:nucleoside deaminase [Gryllotalpicola reticulitermitis]|uniref:tRNA-specific adenosine deaminase n=1 Tax=Gryllotalpicola reticulitermitis TaxID=1184153 RepID=A0ABV8QA68_9MICO
MLIPPPEYDAWMGLALDEARAALATGDVPVGAVVVGPSAEVLGRGRNAREARQDPTAHAEIEALRAAAAARGEWQLTDAVLVVTLEPCAMCAGAILSARVPTVAFGAWDEKAGAAGSVYDLLRDRRLPQRATVYAGIREPECAALLTEFFDERRAPRTE